MITETDITIQQAAERIGLLFAVGRASNGHRRYSPEDIARVELLNRLRTTRMPIREMQRFAALLPEGPSSYPERRALLEEHQQLVCARLDEIQQNLVAIEKKIAYYREQEA